eukprot:TRINITY_DN5858_c0_g1_i1.p1 TRINITY_DN5858_c0_g1~~TRINITY_DN5858_c0_g1_i1.p1  ORF type:complete len:518 (+),score=141.07 TRINITY_DN5858_c0_g1_i1:30-1556(+)
MGCTTSRGGAGGAAGARVSAGSNTVTLIMLGVDNAGKTTIVSELKGEDQSDVIVAPTVGFSSEVLKECGMTVKLFDLGGCENFRGIWPRYYAEVHGAIFVVDSADEARLAAAQKVFSEALSHKWLANKPILIYANKQDLAEALPLTTILERLALPQEYYRLAFACSAKTQDQRLRKGFHALVKEIKGRRKVLAPRLRHDLEEQDVVNAQEREARMKKLKAIREAKEKAEKDRLEREKQNTQEEEGDEVEQSEEEGGGRQEGEEQQEQQEQQPEYEAQGDDADACARRRTRAEKGKDLESNEAVGATPGEVDLSAKTRRTDSTQTLGHSPRPTAPATNTTTAAACEEAPPPPVPQAAFAVDSPKRPQMAAPRGTPRQTPRVEEAPLDSQRGVHAPKNSADDCSADNDCTLPGAVNPPSSGGNSSLDSASLMSSSASGCSGSADGSSSSSNNNRGRNDVDPVAERVLTTTAAKEVLSPGDFPHVAGHVACRVKLPPLPYVPPSSHFMVPE